jgi:hypothetical protein
MKNIHKRAVGAYQIRITVGNKHIPDEDVKGLSPRQLEKNLEDKRAEFEVECHIGKPKPRALSDLAHMWFEAMTCRKAHARIISVLSAMFVSTPWLLK